MSDNIDDIGDDWAAALSEQADAREAKQPAGRSTPPGALLEDIVEDDLPTAQGNDYPRAQFQNLENDNGAGRGDDTNLDVILDIPVTISMEIGRTRINIRNLLQLNQGSVVELDRLAGEPMDVLVNGTLIAHGEVVVVNEKFGIRLTDVISPAERVKKLK